jgi:hypothetical protein
VGGVLVGKREREELMGRKEGEKGESTCGGFPDLVLSCFQAVPRTHVLWSCIAIIFRSRPPILVSGRSPHMHRCHVLYTNPPPEPPKCHVPTFAAAALFKFRSKERVLHEQYPNSRALHSRVSVNVSGGRGHGVHAWLARRRPAVLAGLLVTNLVVAG